MRPGCLGDVERGPRISWLAAHVEEQRTRRVQDPCDGANPLPSPGQISAFWQTIVIGSVADTQIVRWRCDDRGDGPGIEPLQNLEGIIKEKAERAPGCGQNRVWGGKRRRLPGSGHRVSVTRVRPSDSSGCSSSDRSERRSRRRQRVIPAVSGMLAGGAFLLHVRHLAIRRDFAVVARYTATSQRGESEESNQ